MTTALRSELDRAISRAKAAGVEVCGHGHMKVTHDLLFCVASQRDINHWHIVRLVNGSRLACDCPSRVICVLRAAAHLELERESATRAANAANDARGERDAANDRRDADRWELIEAGNW
jgi:hypothetical protein